MLTEQDARQLIGSKVVTEAGDEIGTVAGMLLDEETRRPELVTISTGPFGSGERAVPVQNARFNGGRVIVPFDRDAIKDAPSVEVTAGRLSEDDEQRVYAHFDMHYDSGHATVDPAEHDLGSDRPADE